MKKYIFVVVFVFLAVFAFSRGQKDSFELGIALPYFIENQTTSGIDVKTEMSTFAINYSGISYYTDKVGLGAYGNLIFPQKITISALGQSASVERSAYDFLMALDLLVGPSFMLYKNENFYLPLSAGIHFFQIWSVANSLSSNGTEIGLGANITGEYHFNNIVYLLARFQLTLDLYSWATVEQYVGYNKAKVSNSGSLTAWGINPTIGIGFTF
jgi:hypothetical protein